MCTREFDTVQIDEKILKLCHQKYNYLVINVIIMLIKKFFVKMYKNTLFLGF